MSTASSGLSRVVGRYALYGEIAAGGMATVHYGRLLGPVGFSRTVAIKCLHAQFAKDPEFVAMFLDEARIAARIRHPNVAQTLDVVATQGELFLVMDYVQGETLARLLRAARQAGKLFPVQVTATILSGALHGLHAAHEALDERGQLLGIVHRDVSPQNILVGVDGVPRVIDFGVAKAAGRVQTTREGQLKGKLSYMAPEQLSGAPTRQTDIFAAAIVLWESLTSRRLFSAENEAMVIGKLTSAVIEPPSRWAPAAASLDAIVMRGLERDPAKRWSTAREFAIAIERVTGVCAPSRVGEYVETLAASAILARATKVAEIESSSAALQSQVPTHADITTGQLSATTAMAAMSVEHAQQITAGDVAAGAHAGTVGIGGRSRSDGVREVAPGEAPEVPSQLSGVSVSGGTGTSAPMRNRLALFLALSLIAALLVIFALSVTAKVRAPVGAVAPPNSEHADAVGASAPGRDSAPPEPIPQAVVSATGGPPSQSAAPPPATTQRRPPAPVPPTTPTIRVTPAPPVAPSSCTPPYTYNPDGTKKWKPECL